MIKTSNKILLKSGFTLIELLIVIAIIGILSGVVFVSTQGATLSAKHAAAISTASSALPELVTCNDDMGNATAGTPAAGSIICCTTAAACPTAMAGHSATWGTLANAGWQYGDGANGLKPTGDVYPDGNYVFYLTRINGSGTGLDLITCSMATNGCS